MRGDMPKVIVERPRRGAGWVRKGRPLRDDDLELSEAGLKAHVRLRGESKSLNENLAPLKRYLAAQVGRPWDKVWSEVCKSLKPSNTVQQHVRDHVSDFVAVNTSLKDGEVWVQGRGRWGAPARLKDSFVELYVDPKSGLLLRNKHRASWAKRWKARAAAEARTRAKRMRVVSQTVQLHLVADCWWQVTLAAVPTTAQTVAARVGPQRVAFEHPVEDVLLRKAGTAEARRALYGRPGVYAAAKRQLSSKEIRALGLR